MNTILFDLDGTLLPMDQELFIKEYFQQLVQHFASSDLDPKQLVKAVNYGTQAMMQNDGTITNEVCFWNTFSNILGSQSKELEPQFHTFYETSFQNAKISTKQNSTASNLIELLKSKGYDIIIATNPLFPKVATHSRIKWAGLNVDDFTHITTYETSSFCKPNPFYYSEILSMYGKKPEDCMMVGNDVDEDMCAKEIGMACYLITDCLINKSDVNIDSFSHGTLDDFYRIDRKSVV